jgi:hypothetical protein
MSANEGTTRVMAIVTFREFTHDEWGKIMGNEKLKYCSVNPRPAFISQSELSNSMFTMASNLLDGMNLTAVAVIDE